MKKSLIALAVLAASGAAMAQSSVTLYGIADIWFGSTKTEISGADAVAAGVNGSLRQTKLDSGGINTSRWGLKGSEDLGGGLKANFLLEQGFLLDTGAAKDSEAGAFGRYAYVGFSGGFGEVRLGKVGTAYDDIRGTNNNTFDSALSATPWIAYAGTGNNEIYYAFPTMGGFTGAVSYALGEDKTSAASAGKIFALNVQYAAGPLMVGYAHQAETSGSLLDLGLVDGINETLTNIGVPPADLVVSPAGSKAKYNFLTASYDLGMATVKGGYNQAKFTEAGVDGALKFKEFQVGVDVPLSTALTLAVGYGQSKAKFDSADLYKAKAFSAAVNYTLSKRTAVYAGFNNTKVTFDAGNVADAQIKSNLYVVGVNHKF